MKVEFNIKPDWNQLAEELHNEDCEVQAKFFSDFVGYLFADRWWPDQVESVCDELMQKWYYDHYHVKEFCKEILERMNDNE